MTYISMPLKDTDYKLLEHFPLIEYMVCRNEYNHCCISALTDGVQVVCIAVLSEMENRCKIEVLEVLKEKRRQGIGSKMLSYIKEDNKIIELNSIKDAENFYIMNGFVKTKEPSTFLWVRV